MTSLLFLYFVHFFGPYRAAESIKKKIEELIKAQKIANLNDDQLGVLKHRHDLMSSFSYSEYMASGRESG